MSFSHRNCDHPSTSAARAACRRSRAGNPAPVTSTDDLLDALVGIDRNTTTGYLNGPLKAENPTWLYFTPVDDDTPHVSFLTSAAVIANGGIRPPGTEGMKSTTGKPKQRTRQIKKTPLDNPHPEKNEVSERKPITNDKVITIGLYRHDDALYRVRISTRTNKPYAVRVTEENTWQGEFIPGFLKNLRASERVEEQPRVRREGAAEGFYEMNGNIYRVKTSRTSGRRYAKLITEDNVRGEFASGVVFELTEEMRLSAERAAAFGKLTGVCLICARELTKTESIERGIGPICYAKMGW